MKCPDCGGAASPDAVVCPACGFPLRKDAIHRSTGRSSRANTVGVAVAALLSASVVAALVLPRMPKGDPAEMETGAGTILNLASVTQDLYRMDHGRYARTFAELRSAGWEDETARGYTLEIVDADSTDLCIQALPQAHAAWLPMRVRKFGVIERGLRCGEPLRKSRVAVLASATAELHGVYGDADLWRHRYGRLPQTEAEMQRARTWRHPEFAVHFSPFPARRSYCAEVSLQGEAAVLLSLGESGEIHDGGGCQGRIVDRVGRSAGTKRS